MHSCPGWQTTCFTYWKGRGWLSPPMAHCVVTGYCNYCSSLRLSSSFLNQPHPGPLFSPPLPSKPKGWAEVLWERGEQWILKRRRSSSKPLDPAQPDSQWAGRQGNKGPFQADFQPSLVSSPPLAPNQFLPAQVLQYWKYLLAAILLSSQLHEYLNLLGTSIPQFLASMERFAKQPWRVQMYSQ